MTLIIVYIVVCTEGTCTNISLGNGTVRTYDSVLAPRLSSYSWEWVFVGVAQTVSDNDRESLTVDDAGSGTPQRRNACTICPCGCVGTPVRIIVKSVQYDTINDTAIMRQLRDFSGTRTGVADIPSRMWRHQW